MSRFTFASIFTLVALISAVFVDATANDNGVTAATKKRFAAVPVAQPVAAASKAAPQVPPQHLFLIRSTLAALSDANRSGNYSVLRDLASPAFQAKHSAADLARIFTDARTRPIDLAAALVTEPRLTESARTPENGFHLAGYFATEPERLTFNLQFDAVGGHWRIAGIAVGTQPTSASLPAAK